MLKAGVHFGHRTSRWHPKMEQYIFGVRGGIHVIDIEKTQEELEKTLNYMSSVAARGGVILFVGTKKQITGAVEKTAIGCGMPYVNNRWLGGTFTNFDEIKKLIKNYLDLKDKREKGELKKYTKLEQLQFDRKIEDLEEKIGGISSLTKLPDAIFVFDVRNEKTAIEEAQNRGIKIIAVCDTNVNPDDVDHVIPANDDSISSLQLIGRLAAEAINEGKKIPKQAEEERLKKKKKAEEEKEEETSEDVDVTEASKETVEDLDDEVKEQLAKEKEESKRK